MLESISATMRWVESPRARPVGVLNEIASGDRDRMGHSAPQCKRDYLFPAAVRDDECGTMLAEKKRLRLTNLPDRTDVLIC